MRFFTWYFSKKVLPYWVILLADSLIVFLSCLFTYWVMHRTQVTYDNRYAVLVSSTVCAVLSMVGARIFRTYAGVLRYSSFVDLMKVANAHTIGNMITSFRFLRISPNNSTRVIDYAPFDLSVVFMLRIWI